MVARTSNGQFRKGHSGNPKGRPPGRSTREIVRGVLTDDGGAGLAAWVRGLMEDHDVKAAAVVLGLLEWLDGKAPAPESVGLSHDDWILSGALDDDGLSEAKRMLLAGTGHYDDD